MKWLTSLAFAATAMANPIFPVNGLPAVPNQRYVLLVTTDDAQSPSLNNTYLSIRKDTLGIFDDGKSENAVKFIQHPLDGDVVEMLRDDGTISHRFGLEANAGNTTFTLKDFIVPPGNEEGNESHDSDPSYEFRLEGDDPAIPSKVVSSKLGDKGKWAAFPQGEDKAWELHLTTAESVTTENYVPVNLFYIGISTIQT